MQTPPQMTLLQGAALQVAVVHLPPVFRRGVSAALTEAGYRVDAPDDLERWAADGRGRRMVLTDDSDRALGTLQRLRAAAPHVLSVVLLSDASAYPRVLPCCTGAVPMDGDVEDVLTAVQVAASGFTLVPVPIARELTARATPPVPSPGVDEHERSWLRQLAAGTTVAALSRAERYSERDMYRLLAHLYQRLGARTRTEALLLADRAGLLAAPASGGPRSASAQR